MKNIEIIHHKSLQKAQDHALWLTFLKRVKGLNYRAAINAHGEYLVVPVSNHTFDKWQFEKLPNEYVDISYKEIEKIRQDCEQLPHWEELCGVLSNINGEVLRFILEYQVNLERFIRFELASRGHDKNHKWCGFEKAREIWLN